jgi:hypothetical protein
MKTLKTVTGVIALSTFIMFFPFLFTIVLVTPSICTLALLIYGFIMFGTCVLYIILYDKEC